MIFSFFELLVIFKFLSVFEMDIVNFVLGVHICHGVGLIKVLEINQLVYG